ncbi:A24 family peptidase [Magnetovibrio blakemorei]|uniref:Prepilin type IV endopeptidase peptidase domain-containing protein n=1 Tax=Magnetovibrio blakemorei TaxID=28181 RepID=A0A1E5QAG4_9PROT|nr:prepilin peptidase [Magnetovibrio blakemorei]OEJ68924.1 hypothetical protein BEN30_05300 [Magnetovibrio blakemorei]
MATLQSEFLIFYIALLIYGAWSDARTLKIPNWVSLTLLVAFFPTALSAGLSLETISWHLGGGLLFLVAGFVLFAFGLFGGGDAKLLAVCALWTGWDQLLWLLAAVVLVGGGLCILVIILRRGLGMWPDWLVNAAKGLFEPNKAVPYGIAIAAGALMVLPRMAIFPPMWRDLLALILG